MFDLNNLMEAAVEMVAVELRARDFHNSIDSTCRSEVQAIGDARLKIDAMTNLELIELIGQTLAAKYPHA